MWYSDKLGRHNLACLATAAAAFIVSQGAQAQALGGTSSLPNPTYSYVLPNADKANTATTANSADSAKTADTATTAATANSLCGTCTISGSQVSGSVASANTANTANTANNANYATSAGSANYANNAGQATQMAPGMGQRNVWMALAGQSISCTSAEYTPYTVWYGAMVDAYGQPYTRINIYSVFDTGWVAETYNENRAASGVTYPDMAVSLGGLIGQIYNLNTAGAPATNGNGSHSQHIACVAYWS